MKKIFLSAVLFFCSFVLLNCEIKVKSDTANVGPLSVLIKYGDLNYYFYYKLEKGSEKKFDLSKNVKKLQDIKIYAYPLKNSAGQKITKDMENKVLNDGSKIAQNVLGQALSSTENIVDNQTYRIFADGSGLGEEGKVTEKPAVI